MTPNVRHERQLEAGEACRKLSMDGLGGTFHFSRLGALFESGDLDFDVHSWV